MIGPCPEAPAWLVAFNGVLNVVQAVLLAFIAQRAVRKNREEAAEKGRVNEEP